MDNPRQIFASSKITEFARYWGFSGFSGSLPCPCPRTQMVMWRGMGSCPIIGGEAVHPPRAMHTAIPRTIIITVSDAMFLRTTSSYEYINEVVGESTIYIVF